MNKELISRSHKDLNEEDKGKYLQKLFESTIGNNITFFSPFGDKNIIYCDFTASGRGLYQIEQFISSQILPFYSNVHSNCGHLAEQSEAFRQEAKSIVRRYCHTDENNSIIFTGQGTTSCISKLIKLLHLNEYYHFYNLLKTLSETFSKFKLKSLPNDLFKELNESIISAIQLQYSKLFQVTNFCYANRWGGFDCILCRMGFTMESQYNEHSLNEIHLTNLSLLKTRTSKESFIDDITQNFDSKSDNFIFNLIESEHLFEPIVFLSLYEHNSNCLSWRETKAKIIYVNDEIDLEEKINLYKDYYIKMGSFIACSNITGQFIDIDAYSIIMHQNKGLAFFDFATAAPYVQMDMNYVLSDDYRKLLGFKRHFSNEEKKLGFKDSLFFSPHKFLGGPNTPGVLIIQQRCVRNLHVPSEPGGGVVLFVTKDSQNYVKNIEMREESGTPDIIGSVRIGLSLLIREKINHNDILKIDKEINGFVYHELSNINNLYLLSDSIDDNRKINRIPIYSFLISFKGKLFHPNFISALLNDLFGIQSRPGCSCSSMYGQKLLGISDEFLKKLEELTCTGREIYRPGFTRINLPYFYPMYVTKYIVSAIKFLSVNAWKFIPLYAFKIERGKFYHRNEDEGKKWMNDIKFTNGDIVIPTFFPNDNKDFISEKVLDNLIQQAIDFSTDDNIRYMTKNIIGKAKISLSSLFEDQEDNRWFLIYDDIEELISMKNANEIIESYINQSLSVNFKPLYNNTKTIKDINKDIKEGNPSISKSQNDNNSLDSNDLFEIGSLDFSTKKEKSKKPSISLFPEIPNKILTLVGEATKNFNMLQPHDRILVGMSGGKDSMTLLHTLLYFKRKIPFKLEIGGITVNPQSNDYDPSPLIAYMKKLEIPYFFESDSIMANAKKNMQNNSICSYCARMKRGMIYNCARREKYNVIALGQHLDDLAESFLMSVFHNGLLRTMKANYTIDAGDLRVIRPLIYCREKMFKDFVTDNHLPIIQENCPACFSAPKERQRMKVLLSQQENLYPQLFPSLQKAMIPLMRGIIKDTNNKEDDNEI